MSVIVSDSGFATDDWTGGFVPLADLPANAGGAHGLDLANTDDPATLEGRLEGLAIIRVAFPSSADGRGFTLGAQLRRMGFAGRLRAHGPLLADQYAMARRTGFDEVEIPDEMAARQPEEQWLFRNDWTEFHHQARLRG